MRNKLYLDHIQYDRIYTKLKSKYTINRETFQQEFDIVLENGKNVAIIELKSLPDKEELQDLARIKSSYKRCFPIDKDKTIKIYIGSLNYKDGVIEHASRQSIPLLTLQNELVKVFKRDKKSHGKDPS